MKKLLLAAVAVLGLTIIGPAFAKMEQAGSGADRYLVGYDRTPGAADRAAVARAGGEVLRSFPNVNALAVRIAPAAAQQLSRSPNVSYVEVDERRYALGLADGQATPSPSNGLYGLLTTKFAL